MKVQVFLKGQNIKNITVKRTKDIQKQKMQLQLLHKIHNFTTHMKYLKSTQVLIINMLNVDLIKRSALVGLSK